METGASNFINWITKKGPYLSFGGILFGLILHIIGVSTNYWLEGSRLDGPDDTADVVRVNVGLRSQRIEYRNWTVQETDSDLTNQTPQGIILAIACISVLLCLITIVKAIHVVVGTSGFIATPLLIVSLVLLQKDMEINQVKVETGRTTWPQLSISWSFHLVFAGLLINTLSTTFFLTLQLMKSELEDEAKRRKPVSDISKIRMSATGF